MMRYRNSNDIPMASRGLPGLLTRLSGIANSYLNGGGTFSTVKDSDLVFTDIVTNDVSTAKHGLAPKAPNSNTQFLDGTGAYSASGQIPFPAAQNPSTGANVLDDYEEGTFTPTIVSSGGGAATYTTQVGRYIKVGKKVWVAGQILLATKGTLAAGAASIGALPFTVENLTNGSVGGITIHYFGNMTTAIVLITAFAVPNATTAALEQLSAAATGMGGTTIADIGATFQIYFSGTYQASA